MSSHPLLLVRLSSNSHGQPTVKHDTICATTKVTLLEKMKLVRTTNSTLTLSPKGSVLHLHRPFNLRLPDSHLPFPDPLLLDPFIFDSMLHTSGPPLLDHSV
jgi:hypothetical protein